MPCPSPKATGTASYLQESERTRSPRNCSRRTCGVHLLANGVWIYSPSTWSTPLLANCILTYSPSTLGHRGFIERGKGINNNNGIHGPSSAMRPWATTQVFWWIR